MAKRKLGKLYKEITSEDISLREAEKDIDIFLETLTDALLVDGGVKFTRIGVFEIFTRKPRVVANPVTKERMTIYPKKTVKFRMSKKIK